MIGISVNPELTVDEFQYELPNELIAQKPVTKREMSKMLSLGRKDGRIEHKNFREVVDMLRPDDVLVMNNARVIPARFDARRLSGGQIEVFILDGWTESDVRRVLLKPARRVQIGENLILRNGSRLEILERDGKEFVVRLISKMNWFDFLQMFGRMPLPPYIKRDDSDPREVMDRERYQTVYAECFGAVAAPTAGLHFTEKILQVLQEKGIKLVRITLWVGWGTFKPVSAYRISDHKMETEIYSISDSASRVIKTAKAAGKRIVAVGTTSTRALESWIRAYPDLSPVHQAESCLYITPGLTFKMIDALITNFHLPRST